MRNQEQHESPDQPVALGLCQCGCGTSTNVAADGRGRRYLRGHNCRKPLRYVKIPSGYSSDCWIWQLSKLATRYGQVRSGPEMVLAHRLYYEERRGPIPEGMTLDHLCRVRACVNPEHLEPVTHRENVRRGKVPKLDLERVAEIRCATGSNAEIARRFGISQSQVSRIRNNKSWITLEGLS